MSIDIPIEMNWDFYGRTDSIELYEDEVLKEIIGIAEDFEVMRFSHKEYSNTDLKTKINYARTLLISYLPSQKAISKSKREPVQNQGGESGVGASSWSTDKKRAKKGIALLCSVVSFIFFLISILPLNPALLP